MVLQVEMDICRWREGEGRKHKCWRQQRQTRKRKGRGGEGRGGEGGAHPWFHRTHEGHRYLHRTY